ncbi:MAG: mechanosensitive ion channel family protein [Flavobacteriales bacterium]
MKEGLEVHIDKAQDYTNLLIDLVISYAPKVVMAILLLIIGFWMIKRFAKMVDRMMETRDFDESLRPFLTSLVGIGLKIMLVISVAGMLGIETTSFVAILGAAGLAVGLALQGTLANFAGGVLILLFKPIKVGDFIKAQGHMGTVLEIQIFVTIIKTPDQETVFIPNGVLSNGDIKNYTTSDVMRINLEIGVSYDTDVAKAKQIILDVMNNHPLVLKDPTPVVGLLNLGDSALVLAVKPFSTTNDYWTVWFDINEQCLTALQQAGVKIPFPQLDVHMPKP